MLYPILIIVTAVILLYLFLVMPQLTHRPDLSHWTFIHYAHRGLHQSHSNSPENSLTAFRMAVEQNYGIELDVQLSKDNVPVVFHDYSLKRLCGIDKKVCDLTLKELKKLYLYNSKERIPTFQEVLDLVNGKVPLIVEFKSETSKVTVCDISAPLLDKYKGLYCIESFNPMVLIWYKKNRPGIMRGQLASNLIKDKEKGSQIMYFVLQNLLLNFLTKPNFISYNYIHRNMLSFILNRNLYKIPTFAWTIKSQESLEKSKRSFDFFIFDHFIPKSQEV